MATVTLSNVEKRYPNGAHAIRGVNMDVGDGDFIVFVGPSGCGKSTLLRMVAGLETVSEGEITIDGRRINEVSPADRDVAMVFQNYALYPHMTVEGNLSYGLKNRGGTKEEIRARVVEVAKMLHIDEFLERKPNQLSGGQRQRVAMGRAIVRSPKVFLFDEPLSNLDAKLRVQMRMEIKKLQRQMGVTSIYVTHDQTEAMTLADRLMVLNEGSVEQFGTPIELYETPASVFVAEFIGSPSMNFLSGQIGADGSTLRLENGAKFTLHASAGNTAVQDVHVGIRPEHLALSDHGDGSTGFDVDVVEQLGADTLVHGNLTGTDVAITIRLEGIQQYEQGSDLRLIIPSEKIHLFDKASGKRIN